MAPDHTVHLRLEEPIPQEQKKAESGTRIPIITTKTAERNATEM